MGECFFWYRPVVVVVVFWLRSNEYILDIFYWGVEKTINGIHVV